MLQKTGPFRLLRGRNTTRRLRGIAPKTAIVALRIAPKTAVVALSLALCALIAAGCDDSDSGTKKTTGSTGPDSAGRVTGYNVTGKIIADNKFRPNPNGFQFENYGDNIKVRNLGPKEMVDLFGEQVCASSPGPNCALIPPAQEWRDAANAAMDGGHCFGLSVTSIASYTGSLNPSSFGNSVVYKLGLSGNGDLQGRIARDFVTQIFESVLSQTIVRSPAEELDALIKSLKPGAKDYYTIAIFMADGSGGHAVTPFAVEQKDDRTFAILVYDNNFPGVTRAIKVNRQKNTWSYIGGPDPKDVDYLYKGNAKTDSMKLFPTAPALARQPCPFCDGDHIEAGNPDSGTLLGAATRYNELTLTGSATNNARLLIVDSKGRRAGYFNGEYRNEIPGVKIVRTVISEPTWRSDEEPIYRLPPDLDFKVVLDGSELKRPDTESLTLVGPGRYVEIQNIQLNPGQRDELDILDNGTGYSYKSDSDEQESPRLSAGIEGKLVSYDFGVKATGLSRGARIHLDLDQKAQAFTVIANRGENGKAGGAGTYAFEQTRLTSEGAERFERTVKLGNGDVGVVQFDTGRVLSEPQLFLHTFGGSDRLLDFQRVGG